MHSTAHARGSVLSTLPRQASAAARQRIGRKRLPPAKRLYRIALWSVTGFVLVFGRYQSSARSITFCRVRRYFLRFTGRKRMLNARFSLLDNAIPRGVSSIKHSEMLKRWEMTSLLMSHWASSFLPMLNFDQMFSAVSVVAIGFTRMARNAPRSRIAALQSWVWVRRSWKIQADSPIAPAGHRSWRV